ncbi:S1C family serine protease [Cellulomonas soli]|uniref:S1C family serine protease n=1 Tax=Cellulomonas soli TaxID=931535 RepID=UPI003F84FD88
MTTASGDDQPPIPSQPEHPVQVPPQPAAPAPPQPFAPPAGRRLPDFPAAPTPPAPAPGTPPSAVPAFGAPNVPAPGFAAPGPAQSTFSAPGPAQPTFAAPVPPAQGGAPFAPPVPPAAAGASARSRGRALSVVWVVPLIVLSLVAGVVGGVLGARSTGGARPADAGLPTVSITGSVDRAPDSVAGIASAVLPSVVSIEVTASDGTSTGSGFVLRQDGYILTNNHVVASADEVGSSIVVLFADGTQVDATVVGRTADYDLAVVKVEADGLTPLLLGDSDAVVVGDPVVAIGAPLGLVGTVTTGIVSALNRPVSAGDSQDTAFINAIQTDAAINPGNSGGPLVNAAGEVVGINSAIAQAPGTDTTAAGSIGLGFAIPSNQARRTAEQLIETGTATYPIIGVLLDDRYTGEGVQVASEDNDGTAAVTPGGPADVAGIRRGDVILEIDGRPVTDPEELIVTIRAHTPGDVVVLRVRTGEKERDVRVELSESSGG